MNNLREIAQKFKIAQDVNVYQDELMSRRFSFKVGGITPLLLEPLSEESFFNILELLEKENIPYFILGGGTNIVFSDDGFDGVIVTTVKLNKIEPIFVSENNYVLKAQCGTSMNALVQFAIKNGFSGLEAFCGLPGTCGGACYMNARCFDLEVSNVVEKIECFEIACSESQNSTCIKKIINYNESDWSYKKSPFTDTKNVIVNVEFRVKKVLESEMQNLQSVADSFMKQRIEKGHFKFPCAGSVFKNNREFGKPTGQIIDELGLKGFSIGGAQIAPWHGNIIINRQNATFCDIKKLVEYIKTQIKEKKGFSLEEEIIFK